MDYEKIVRINKEYKSLEKLFLDLVESNLEHYTYEMTEGMKNFK